MPLIAIAGGTSPTLGRSIITAILAEGTNTPLILSSRPPPANGRLHGAEVRHVDYTSQRSLVAALRGVHTVISVLKIPGPDWALYQNRLVRAAKEAGVRRFAPSEFGLGPEANVRVDVLGAKSVVWVACNASGLEVTRFCCGMFMNYLAIGMPESERRDELLDGLEGEPVIWNLAAGTAEHPVRSDGSTPRITLTRLRDVGRFVAAACALLDGQWPSIMSMVGETVRVADVTDMIEKLSGRLMARWTVDRAELQKRVDEVEGMGRNPDEIATKMMSQMSLLALEEQEGLNIMSPVANEFCLDVEAQGVRLYLKEVFGRT